MDLSLNQLSGTLPTAWQNLASLQQLDMSNNTLMSTIPPEWYSGTPKMSLLSQLTLMGNPGM